MPNLEELTALVQLVTLVTLVSGFLFAAYEWRSTRRDRQRAAQVLLLHSFETPDFVRAMRRIVELPDGMSKDAIEAKLGETGTDLLWYWLGSMESVGLFVHSREIDIHLVDQTYSGPLLVSWRKLATYAADVRREMGRDSMHEWFQWLAEQVERLEREQGRSPAHISERDWRP